jgi:hypothetical protein
MNKTKGAFGGLYPHQIIKEMRAELAKTSLLLAAVIKHYKITQPDMNAIAEEYMRDQEAKVRDASSSPIPPNPV